MSEQLPYLAAPGSIATALTKIKVAATPEKVSQDFIKTKLQIKGGTGNALMPFLKRIGFISTDNSPTDIYKSFRNHSLSKKAAFDAMKIGYKPLFDQNEYAHELNDIDLKGAIISVTGLEENSNVVSLIMRTFKNMKTFASSNGKEDDNSQDKPDPNEGIKDKSDKGGSSGKLGMNLSYTINLNLPATSDISVFNAIFKSLKENLLHENK